MTPTFQQCGQCGFPDLEKAHPDIAASPVLELLNTNSAPSVSEANAIGVYLKNADENIEHLRQHIRSVTSVLEKLENDHHTLQQRRDEHHAFLTPFRRLYPDILVEIFRLLPKGVPPRRLPSVLDGTNTASGPLLLSQVCKSWRAVALDTPDLWTMIRIIADVDKYSQTQLINLWLTRSKTLPLTVGILESTQRHSPEVYESGAFSARCSSNPALAAVLDQSHRWENVYFMLPSISGAWDGLSQIKDNLKSVRLLSFTASRVPPPQTHSTLEYFANLPKIQHLSLDHGTAVHGPEPSISNFTIILPYDTITSLSIVDHKEKHVSIEICIEIINRLRNLRECTVHCGTLSNPSYQLHHRITHPFLHTLVVIPQMGHEPYFGEDSSDEEISDMDEDPFDDGLGILFDSLELPALERLTFYQEKGRAWDCHCFSRFLSRSPNIKFFELILKSRDTMLSSFIKALRNLPSLSHLVYHGSSLFYQNNFLEMLALKKNHQVPSPFLPNLRRLEFCVSDLGCFDELMDIIQARTLHAEDNHVLKLEFFKCDVQFGYANDIRHTGDTPLVLNRLIRDGMQIQFTVSQKSIFSSPKFPKYLISETYGIPRTIF